MTSPAKGKLIIFSAPSGAGKTTIVHWLMKQIPDLAFSVSATSRKKRPGEVHGRDYYFLDVDDFKQRIRQNAFVEWEEVYENQFYGTLISEVERLRKEGKHVVFDVDVKGGMNIKRLYGNDALSVFVQPPSIEELERRLRARNTDSEESIRKRVKKAGYELQYAKHFDVVIVNDNLEEAQQKTLEVVMEFLGKEPATLKRWR
jgi:guanylate kinase